MDELNPIKKKYKEKFPDFKEGVLAKNKLILEHVILNRNIKREIKLDNKKISIQNGKKVLDSLKWAVYYDRKQRFYIAFYVAVTEDKLVHLTNFIYLFALYLHFKW